MRPRVRIACHRVEIACLWVGKKCSRVEKICFQGEKKGWNIRTMGCFSRGYIFSNPGLKKRLGGLKKKVRVEKNCWRVE